MRNKIMIIGIAASLIAGPAMAEGGSASKEEKIVGVIGAASGALAGGPVGLIIGAAFGAKLGDEFDQRNDKVDMLDDSLIMSQQRIQDLQQNVDALNSDIDEMGTEFRQLQQVARPELLALMQAGIEMDLLFRTDEDVLSNTTGQRLQHLASTLSSMPDVYIQIDGFADERGDATYNQNLSVRRAEYVRDLLTASGVASTRIKVSAHGESPAIDASVDSFALERKVSLTLYVEDAPSFAANPAGH